MSFSYLDSVRLRPTTPADVAALFAFQLDPEANRMAMVRPRDEATFFALWEGIFADPQVVKRVIVDEDERLLGSINCIQREGLDYVGYWVAREHWGRGIAGRALTLFLSEVTRRPLHARVAASNAASLKILLRSGFVEVARGWDEGNARLVACDEVQLTLGALPA